MGCMVPGILNLFIMGLLDGIVKGVTGLFKSVPILGNIVSDVQDEYEADRNFEKQEDLMFDVMAQQNQYNIDAFNRENAYNHPLAQRQRNVEAGINPNWSDGNAIAGTQTSTTQPAGAPDITSILNSINQTKQMKINQQMADSQQKVNERQGAMYDAQTADFAASAKVKSEEAKGLEIENSRKAEKLDKTILQIDEAIEHSKQERAKLANDIEVANALKEPQIKEALAHADALLAQGRKDDAEAIYQTQILGPMKSKLSSEAFKNLQDGLKAKSEIGVAWYNAKTQRMELNETQRHNLVMEKFEYDRVELEYKLGQVEANHKWMLDQKNYQEAYKSYLDNTLQWFLINHGYFDVARETMYAALDKLQGEASEALSKGEITANDLKMYYIDKLSKWLHGVETRAVNIAR